ncbi:hypothetical protein BVH06_00625 [Pseudomonas sp. PA27(2017)]|nr:hypothetical protein BVH06_00625 [Pseudomonas sp. PA27(2017)]
MKIMYFAEPFRVGKEIDIRRKLDIATIYPLSAIDPEPHIGGRRSRAIIQHHRCYLSMLMAMSIDMA